MKRPASHQGYEVSEDQKRQEIIEKTKDLAPLTAPLLPATAMWRWAPSGERVPERLRISSSPWIAVA
jgi:hypothetical protein